MPSTLSDGRVMGWRKAELEKKNLQPTLKGFKAPPSGGGGSVMVWGWMSASGFGELAFIDGMLDKIVYSNILKNNLEKVPKKLGILGSFKFYQDNDPKPTAWVILKKVIVYLIEIKMDSSDACLENTPPSIKETAENVISNVNTL
uniref:Uncharacterized protein n=1 Tax=Rhodnius prolixus TaxID=13249 RepID=T1HYC3_RHOPR